MAGCRQTPYKLMLVEDDQIMRILTREMLYRTNLDIELLEAETGSVAKTLLRSHDFDCVLLDYELPDTDALTLLMELEKGYSRRVPIIILTSCENTDLALSLIRAGAIDYISKSEFSPAILEKAILFSLARCDHHLSFDEQQRSDSDHSIQMAIKERQFHLDTANKALHYLSTHDPLTDIPNRKAALQYLSDIISRASHHSSIIYVLYIDLDFFKTVNDLYGPDIGDQILKEVVSRIYKTVRHNDYLARIASDEFLLYIDRLSDPTIAGNIADKIIKVLRVPFSHDGNDIQLSASVGIANYLGAEQPPELLILNAEYASKEAKNQGRNCYKYHANEINLLVNKRISIERTIRDALAFGWFHLLYQPKIYSSTQKVDSVEALVRLHHPEQGLIPPFEFISIAEQSDLIIDMEKWVINHVCKFLSQWDQMQLTELKVAINISSRHIASGKLQHHLTEALALNNISPERLIIELTERAILEENHCNIEILEELREQGIKLALDDFGTGYSSLSYISNLPVHIIKLDKSFIDNITTNIETRLIIETIIRLADNLNKLTIAEGVETKEQFSILKEIGCTQIQGFYFSKPISQSDLREYVIKNNKLQNSNKITSISADRDV